MEEEFIKMKAFTSPTVRGIVKFVNENEIAKERVISILKDNTTQFTLIYY